MDDPAVTKEADALARRVLLSDGAEAARLIVCEHGGRWAVGLRRELAGEDVPICETRSLASCWETLGASPAGLVVVELTTANVDELLGRLAGLDRDLPLARVAVVADRRLAGYEWLMREAGAVHFVGSPRQLGPLAEVARRHLDQAPARRRSVTEQIWSSLPWGGR